MANPHSQPAPDPLSTQACDCLELTGLRKDWIQRQLDAADHPKPLRVLIATTGLSPGGAENQVLRIMPCLNRLGIEVEHVYFVRSHSLLPRFKTAGLVTHFIDLKDTGALGLIKKTVQLIRAHRYDVVMSFFGMANVYVRLASILARTPVVIACSRSRLLLFRNFKTRLALSALNPFTDAWIINSATNMESLQRLWLMQRPPVHLVPNALTFDGDFSRGRPLEENLQAWIGTRMIVGTCGWISKPKNYDMFLNLAKKVNERRQDVCFLIIGGARAADDAKTRFKNLKRRVADEKLGGFVRLLGPRDDVDYLLPNLTIFAFTSTWEGCPNAVIEAMRASLPIIMTRACDTALLVDEDRNGFVIEKNDVDTMAERVNFLLDSPERRTAFGARSREIAELNFKAENSAWKFALIFIRHLAKQKGRSCLPKTE